MAAQEQRVNVDSCLRPSVARGQRDDLQRTASKGIETDASAREAGRGAVLSRAIALHAFAAQRAGDIAFPEGAEIAVTDRGGKWWRGFLVEGSSASGAAGQTGSGGTFPSNYVLEFLAPAEPCVALFPFAGDLTHDIDHNGIPDISFKAGVELVVEAKTTSWDCEWVYGHVAQSVSQRGFFPASYAGPAPAAKPQVQEVAHLQQKIAELKKQMRKQKLLSAAQQLRLTRSLAREERATALADKLTKSLEAATSKRKKVQAASRAAAQSPRDWQQAAKEMVAEARADAQRLIEEASQAATAANAEHRKQISHQELLRREMRQQHQLVTQALRRELVTMQAALEEEKATRLMEARQIKSEKQRLMAARRVAEREAGELSARYRQHLGNLVAQHDTVLERLAAVIVSQKVAQLACADVGAHQQRLAEQTNVQTKLVLDHTVTAHGIVAAAASRATCKESKAAAEEAHRMALEQLAKGRCEAEAARAALAATQQSVSQLARQTFTSEVQRFQVGFPVRRRLRGGGGGQGLLGLPSSVPYYSAALWVNLSMDGKTIEIHRRPDVGGARPAEAEIVMPLSSISTIRFGATAGEMDLSALRESQWLHFTLVHGHGQTLDLTATADEEPSADAVASAAVIDTIVAVHYLKSEGVNATALRARLHWRSAQMRLHHVSTVSTLII